MDLWVSFPPEFLCYLRSIVADNHRIREETAAWIHCPRQGRLSVSFPQPCCVLWNLELQNLSGSGNARIIPIQEQTASVPMSDSQTMPGCLCSPDGTGLAPHTVVLGSNAHSGTYLPIIVAGWVGGWLKGERKVSHDSSTPQGSLQLHISAASGIQLFHFIYINKQLNFAGFLYSKITLMSRADWGSATESQGAALACPETPKPPQAETASSETCFLGE